MSKKEIEQQEPYVLIDDIAKLFSLQVAKATERAGIAYGYRKLLKCLSHGEEIPQLQLVDEANLTPATVSTTMAKLQAEGVVARRLDPADKRKYYVQLTKLGMMRYDAIQKRSDEVGRIMLEGIGEQEQEQLICTLCKMLDNLKAQEL